MVERMRNGLDLKRSLMISCKYCSNAVALIINGLRMQICETVLNFKTFNVYELHFRFSVFIHNIVWCLFSISVC
jgi:hypothetical protein